MFGDGSCATECSKKMKTDIAASRIIAWNCFIETIFSISGISYDPQLEDVDIQFHASCVYIKMPLFGTGGGRIKSEQ